ncbi:RNA polymerase factor sigma-54 [Acidaminobacter hydrogenoformans]|uniref:RNA polymerase, sigma 54 subunit, RpoN/SigL n=1 Tax=Acidaminobacter hydrogenoformans DSM 2784 TaxID=1120920 RepID=A0A1G5S479_9FIRM|nr:RNA polymerase factor sigma-54 [Acidaminobacter hydrogenoformans]SCZ80978.1 RNA polymerase, sigma 54 subunit, RpoN/SigL [Acidaminobacter hydrogenoformans DSM 2784]
MKMNMNLNMVQTQKLVMTAELKQAIEILQYNSVELKEFIQEELMTNPVLQLQSQDEGSQAAAVSAPEVPEEPIKPQSESSTNDLDNINWKEVSQGMSRERGSAVAVESRDDEFSYESFLPTKESLYDHLAFQLCMSDLKGLDYQVAQFLIENIDKNGYLDLRTEEVLSKFQITEDNYERILSVIQTFDPLGVGARNLAECLKIQLMAGDDALSKLAAGIIEHHLQDLANNRIQNIAKALGAPLEQIQDACDLVKTLEPKPGRAFSVDDETRYVVPDVVITKNEGEYVILVSDSTAPKLYINDFYRRILESEQQSAASEYISKKLSSAMKLIKSIEQRRNTIYKVVEAIVEVQLEFFERGPMYLKTLTLKDIAERVGVHESTVSRAVSGKYLQCPHGIYEIKFFFQSGVSSEMGESVSSESIKKIIKELVDREDPKKPFSDQHLMEELNQIGIMISRRTVAKYRDELFIPSSSKRKRF